MPSLDFVTDLLETLKSQGIDFILTTIQKGKKEYTTHLFHSLSDLNSVYEASKAEERISDLLIDHAEKFSGKKIRRKKKNE